MITFNGRAKVSRRRKLDPRYLGLLRIMERFGLVAYNLYLPTAMDALHNMFHVFQLRKCLTDQDVIVSELPSKLRRNLTLEKRPVWIMDMMKKATRKKVIQTIKVTWKRKAKMKADFS